MAIDPKRVKEIFLEAADLQDEAARAAYLDGACGGDAGLRARVEALLSSHDPEGSFLGTPLVAPSDPDGLATRAFSPGSGGAPNRTGGEAATADDEVPLGFLGPSTRPDSLGRIGHYEVLQVLGQGGFGIVFRAFDDVLHRVVAVKVLSPQMAATSPARKRFLREARSSAQVRHENVVQVYEVGEQPLPYIAMEFIPGETLQQRLDRTGPVDVAEVVRIGRQIAEGLAAAHANDLIHRDIKPANILLEGGQLRVKLTDFGLARAADDASVSQSGIVAGTPMFMAPEQVRGEPLDRRADLFSLGSVLYAMTAGHPPFRANGTIAVLRRVADDAPRPIREIIPETPQWLCDIIAKLHAKDPNDRFQSAREVADLLADCEAQLRTSGRLRDFSRIPAAPRPSGRLRDWKWLAAAVVSLATGLALTESAGVTRLLRGRPELDSSRPGGGAAPVAPVGATTDAARPPIDPDRRAAEYVLSLGYLVPVKVEVNGREQEIQKVSDLPREPFRLISAQVYGTQANDAGMANFQGCKDLIDLSMYVNPIDGPGTVTDAALVYLEDCKHLKSLSLDNSGFTDAGLASFKDCKDLTSLSISSGNVTGAGLLPFQGCKNLATLSLQIALGDAGLAHVGGFKNLTRLGLSGAAITDADLAHLEGLTNLTDLDLSMNSYSPPPGKITDAGLAHLKGATKLTHLNLSWRAITGAGLVHMQGATGLTHLDLSFTEVADAGLDHLRSFKDLVDVNLRQTQVGDAGIAALEGCKKLEMLNLDSTRVGDAGLAHLEGCQGLKFLELDHTRVTDAGLASLKVLKNLTRLGLGTTRVSDAGLAEIAGLVNLSSLDLTTTKVTSRGVRDLAKRRPGCTITWDDGEIGLNQADRGVAEHALKLGGGVEVEVDGARREVKAPDGLPQAAFRLTRARLGDSLELTDAGLEPFKGRQNLDALDLSDTRVTDAGLAHLARLGGLTDLRLVRTKVTAEGVERLAKALPECKITWDGGVTGPK